MYVHFVNRSEKMFRVIKDDNINMAFETIKTVERILQQQPTPTQKTKKCIQDMNTFFEKIKDALLVLDEKQTKYLQIFNHIGGD
jgi:hypothetical protein